MPDAFRLTQTAKHFRTEMFSCCSTPLSRVSEAKILRWISSVLLTETNSSYSENHLEKKEGWTQSELLFSSFSLFFYLFLQSLKTSLLSPQLEHFIFGGRCSEPFGSIKRWSGMICDVCKGMYRERCQKFEYWIFQSTEDKKTLQITTLSALSSLIKTISKHLC